MHLDDETIDTIQLIYQSDIRSMINFIQLNQNLSKSEWEGKIISKLILREIHNKLGDTTIDVNDVICYIHANSIKINMDKSAILNSYFDNVIRTMPGHVSSELLNIIGNILHCTDAKPDIAVNYFCHQLRALYAKTGLVEN